MSSSRSCARSVPAVQPDSAWRAAALPPSGNRCAIRRGLPLARIGLCGRMVPDVVEITGDDAPADVPEEALLPVIPAETAQPSFDAGPPPIAPALGRVPFSLGLAHRIVGSPGASLPPPSHDSSSYRDT